MWISAAPPADRAVARTIRETLSGFPPEYASAPVDGLPESVRRDSVVTAHSLIPAALAGVFGGYRGMLDEALPLTRTQQEMIAVTVSVLNDCFH